MATVRRLMIFIGIVTFFIVPFSASAVSAPSAVDLSVIQGEEDSVEIFVENDAASQEYISFSLVHVSFDDNGQPTLGASAADAPWMHLSQTRSSFEAGEVQPVVVTATPSANFPSGSYAFALLSTEEQEGSYVLTHGTATLIFVTVGSVMGDGRCVSFFRQDDGSFSLTLQNVGQGILYDEGEILLRGPFGSVWAAASSNPSRHRVFAGQTRTWVSESLMIPWWAVGPLEYSLESDLFSSTCPRISAGFGWIPLGIIATGAVGIFLVRRRK